jgi:hypothetical protein
MAGDEDRVALRIALLRLQAELAQQIFDIVTDRYEELGGWDADGLDGLHRVVEGYMSIISAGLVELAEAGAELPGWAEVVRPDQVVHDHINSRLN